MFLVNSRLSPFAATPPGSFRNWEVTLLGSPFSRSYGVSLPSSLTEVLPFTCRVFSAPTCVGLRYGRTAFSLEAFLGGLGLRDSIPLARHLVVPSHCPHQARPQVFSPRTVLQNDTRPVQSARSPVLSASPPRSNEPGAGLEYSPAVHRLRPAASA